MATKVSLINMKGGVGKSTLTVNLAWYFAYFRARKVLVVDLDPQFNASQYLLRTERYQEEILSQKRPTVWDIFEQGTKTPQGKVSITDPQTAIISIALKVHLIPSQLELAYSLKNPSRKERNLSRFLDKIENNYDLVLIDCAPTESVLTTAAYLSSDWLLVPVKPEYLSTIGLPLLVKSMTEFKEDYPESRLKLAGVVFNAASDYLPEEALAKETVRDLARRNKWHVFENEIAHSKLYPTGARTGQPIFRTWKAWGKRKENFFPFCRGVLSTD